MPQADLVDLPHQRAVTQHSIDADFFGVSSLADAVYNLISLTPGSGRDAHSGTARRQDLLKSQRPVVIVNLVGTPR